MTIKIDKGVPMPRARTGSHHFPFNELEVGDSFLVQKTESQDIRALTSLCSARAIQHAKSKIGAGKKFAVRSRNMEVDGEVGVRIWRTQ